MLQEIHVQPAERASLLASLNADYGALALGIQVPRPPPSTNKTLLGRLIAACPCLFTQLDIAATPSAVVHLVELTLGAPITSMNVHEAFEIQHPDQGPAYRYPPIKPCARGGTIMEMLCSEVLSNVGIPAMQPANNGPESGWPVWEMPGHILLNVGRMKALQAFGDILLPCAPTNLVISVKSVKARERLLYSSNAIEGVGFGFFDDPSEFWTSSRMNLYKRMGFSAIYMPKNTLGTVLERLGSQDRLSESVNINGTALYRDLEDFGEDMLRVVGRSSLDL